MRIQSAWNPIGGAAVIGFGGIILLQRLMTFAEDVERHRVGGKADSVFEDWNFLVVFLRFVERMSVFIHKTRIPIHRIINC